MDGHRCQEPPVLRQAFWQVTDSPFARAAAAGDRWASNLPEQNAIMKPKWIVTSAVGGGFNVSAQANTYPDRPDIMDGVAHFYKKNDANVAAKAVNEHAALVAVAEAAENLAGVDFQFDGTSAYAAEQAAQMIRESLANLAAVRAGQPVAAVEYKEAVFNTKEDADCWIAQERRKAGFHVIEAAKATGGFKVVFERRKSSQPETAPVDHLPLVEALMKIASWSEGGEVSGHFDEPSSATIARKALAAVGIVGGVK